MTGFRPGAGPGFAGMTAIRLFRLFGSEPLIVEIFNLIHEYPFYVIASLRPAPSMVQGEVKQSRFIEKSIRLPRRPPKADSSQ